MSSKPIQVELPTGEIIWAQVTGDEGPQNVASGKVLHLDVEEFRRTVRGVSASLREATDELVPDEVQVEFGLQLAFKSGMLISILAAASATASVKITLAWRGDGPTAATTEKLGAGKSEA